MHTEETKERKRLVGPFGANHPSCPCCGSDWDDGAIFDVLRQQEWTKCMTDEQLHVVICETYGAPYRFSREICIELEEDHQDWRDGTSYIQCPDCGATFNADTGWEEKIPENINRK